MTKAELLKMIEEIPDNALVYINGAEDFVVEPEVTKRVAYRSPNAVVYRWLRNYQDAAEKVEVYVIG